MVSCPKCGKKNDDDAEFCSKCGNSLIGSKEKTKESDMIKENVENFADEVVQLGKKAGKTIESGLKQVEKELKKGSSSSDKSENFKKFYRSGKNRYIGGVCGGLAEYSNIDPTIIRILWTILVFFPPGLGAILYVLFWLFTPRNPEHNWD